MYELIWVYVLHAHARNLQALLPVLRDSNPTPFTRHVPRTHCETLEQAKTAPRMPQTLGQGNKHIDLQQYSSPDYNLRVVSFPNLSETTMQNPFNQREKYDEHNRQGR